MDKALSGALAGLAAGLIIGIVSFGLYTLNICRLCLVAIGGGLFTQQMLPQGTTFIWLLLGWVDHLVMSMILGIILVFILHYTGRDYAIVKGAIYGAIVWYFAIGIIAPLAGFTPPSPRAADLLVLLAYHLVFGMLAAWLMVRFGTWKAEKIKT